ncbi:fluoride efflux transporter CrcB [Fervidibacillus albus]|uniref:Fluoride-specific ion channel FluC n=1 Tax=Fervidibacillus albus TaxID=2980026 RepID=A0A9E8RVU3_9BACI|nr:fluoride efflux transporter CrcB [Fervidibacillus albus]WAA11040.1 fluoride efflux transporter CrcB [Fervidibacillus albus]
MWLYVGIGGSLGALTRYGVSLLFSPFQFNGFPIATFSVNILGSFLLGLTLGYVQNNELKNRRLYTGLTAGFLGSFTTFSTFSVETVQFIESGMFLMSVAYMVGSVVFGWMLASSGTKLGKRMWQVGKGLG